MPGLMVRIGPECTACGECHAKCPVSAIAFDGAGLSVIDQETCKGCGACAAACPNEAVALEMAEGLDAVEALFERIRARTEIGI
jgi:heterodisulfide reductase subunit A